MLFAKSFLLFSYRQSSVVLCSLFGGGVVATAAADYVRAAPAGAEVLAKVSHTARAFMGQFSARSRPYSHLS